MKSKFTTCRLLLISLAACLAACGGGDGSAGSSVDSGLECSLQGDVRFTPGRTVDAIYGDGSSSSSVFVNDHWEVRATDRWGVGGAVQSGLTRNTLTKDGLYTWQTAQVVQLNPTSLSHLAWMLEGKWYRTDPVVTEPISPSLGVLNHYAFDWVDVDTGQKRAGAVLERQFLGAETSVWQAQSVRVCRTVSRFLNGQNGTLESETVLSFASGAYKGIPVQVLEDQTGRILRELVRVSDAAPTSSGVTNTTDIR